MRVVELLTKLRQTVGQTAYNMVGDIVRRAIGWSYEGHQNGRREREHACHGLEETVMVQSMNEPAESKERRAGGV